MSDWIVRDPKVRHTMRSAWLIGDRELRTAVVARGEQYAALKARSALPLPGPEERLSHPSVVRRRYPGAAALWSFLTGAPR